MKENAKKVLVVSRSAEFHEELFRGLSRRGVTGLQAKMAVLSALSQSEAEDLMRGRSISAIVLDGTAMAFRWIARKMRRGGFTGPIMVVSDDRDARDAFLDEGCSHQARVCAAAGEICDALGID